MKIDSATFALSAMRAEQFRRDGRPEVAFVGRSNVGKSSLMNALLRRKGLARTSSTPGRTQAVNYFLINDKFWFVDLPGYGFAKASKKDRAKWARLIGRYLEEEGEERRLLLVQLVDAKVGGTDLDRQAAEYFVDLDVPLLIVATKIDKVGRSRRHRQTKVIQQNLELPEDARPLSVSAVTGEGLQPLWNAITSFLEARE
ncbi:MAG: ribosome biogenesis GTP-binding protein YihA/YsxC [Thermoanaerobaculia bacterium]|nr:ribosome biogenesis GTP-binding protein YihA/YsxC [Thermoanaerobaculia bacterium]